MKAEDLALRLADKNQIVKASQGFEEAIDLALEEAGEDGIVCSFGSLYYIGEIRKIMRSEKYDSQK
ncbi:hypothetical protein ACDI16_23825, partial [Oceanobacillus caeni]